jgi:hypothetical protein
MSSIRFPASQTTIMNASTRTDTSAIGAGGRNGYSLSGTALPWVANTRSYNFLQMMRDTTSPGIYSTVRTSLKLFKGTIPTVAQLDAATDYVLASGQPYNGINAINDTFRSTDLLMKINITANTAAFDANNNFNFATDIATASAIGTATWFLVTTAPSLTGNSAAWTFSHMYIAGSYSITGGTGDLQGDIDTFTTGQNARVFSTNVSIPFPLNIV